MSWTDLPEPTNADPGELPLAAWHRALGARMVTFAGYHMPIQYDLRGDLAARCKGGIMAEHLHTRMAAGLFDVSHMGQAILTGPGIAVALERLVPGNITGLKPGRQRYTLLMNDAGGILDDMMVACLAADKFFIVVNASRKRADFAHLAANLPDTIRIEVLEDRALLALQGPAAARVVAQLAPETEGLPFMGGVEASIEGGTCIIFRSGYTGEDGFEASVPAATAEAVANRLLADEAVVPIGLGARDTLRLEAGLCLYGNDIDELTSPIEAGLGWVIPQRRRTDWSFPGGDVIRDQIQNGAPRTRVGLRPEGRAPARALTQIVADDGTEAGNITSGGFGPSVNGPIAMGYVRKGLAEIGTKLHLMVRGKPIPAVVSPLPFVPHRYVR